jgi:DNA repair protein RecO (recombination protein O)
MIVKTKAIVLHLVKYAESSVIVTVYTLGNGRQAYLINGVRSSKSKQKPALLQPMFLLDVEAYHKPGREVHRLKEYKLAGVYQSIPFDVVKSTIAIFIGEILYKVLRNEEKDEHLFDFICHSFSYFDTLEKGASNFHLWFLIQLLGHLGFKINANHSSVLQWFDMKTGQFVPFRPNFPNTPDTEESGQIAELVNLDIEHIGQYLLNGKQRARLLEIIIEYYSLHIDGMGQINSLRIMQQIFE